MSLVSFSAQAQTQKLKVTASFSILGDMVHEVAGDAVELHVLVGADSDAQKARAAHKRDWDNAARFLTLL